MNHAIRMLVGTAIALAAGAAPMHAQLRPITEEPPTAFWFHGGLGVGTVDDPPAVSLGATYQVGAQVVSFRSSGGGGYLQDGIWDWAALYGFGTTGQSFRITGELGAAVVSGKRCTEDGCASFPSVGGIPFAVQLRVTPTSAIALGAYTFANINSEQSFAGLTLSVAIGDVR
jgi:hypothetical protein